MCSRNNFKINMTFKKLILFSLVVFIQAVVITASSSEETLLEGSININKDIISNLRDGVDQLSSVEQMTSVAKAMRNFDSHMGSSERASINTIAQINDDAAIAVGAARAVVLKLESTCDIVLPILKKRSDEHQLNLAINSYLDKTRLLNPTISTAIDKLIIVSAQAVKVDGALLSLENWADAKKQQQMNEERARIQAERTKAYAAAASCLAAGPFAIFTCPAAYAIAAGITEGKTVKEIERAFDSAIRQIDTIRKEIDVIGGKTRSLVDKVKFDKTKMTGIQDQLDQADRGGRMTLKYTSLFFNRFKESISVLLTHCRNYLS